MRLRIPKKARTRHRIVLVICEGDTERIYVEFLRQYYRLPISIKTKVSGNKISQNFLDKYKAELNVTHDDISSVFFIYDGDVQPVLNTIRELDGKAIISTPCIELWFLLHVSEQRGAISSAEILKRLSASHDVWKDYSKGKLNPHQKKLLIDNIHTSCQRSRHLNWPSNPSTNLHDFIDFLESESKG